MNFFTNISILLCFFAQVAQAEIIDGEKYIIKTEQNDYLTYNNWELTFNDNANNAALIKIEKQPQDNKIYMKIVADNRYVNGQWDGKIGTSNNPGWQEVFELEPIEGKKYYVKSNLNNMYLKVDAEKRPELTNEKNVAGKFEFINELAVQRSKFLENSKVELLNDNNRGNVGTKLSSFWNYFAVPSVQEYQRGFANIILSVSFPKSFYPILPASVLNALKGKEISQLDIFWVVQSSELGGMSEPKILLKPHLWLNPNTPKNFHGTIYNKSIQLGIFEINEDIANNIKKNELSGFNISIHDGLFSDEWARLNPKIGADLKQFSFWSVIYDESTESAAATLHSLVDPNNVDTLRALMVKFGTQSLSALIQAIEENGLLQSADPFLSKHDGANAFDFFFHVGEKIKT